MKLLDRYVLRSFMEPFLICSGAFVAIWLMFDYSDKSNDFIQVHATFKQIAGYYLTQLPALLLLSLPIGLLLSLLYSLSSMSRRNEIISMVSAGRSIGRILLPLIVVGILLSGFCLWLNWEQAPHAAGNQKNAIKLMKAGRKAGDTGVLTGHVFRNRSDYRTWYVRKLRPGSDNLDTVHITQQTAAGAITAKYYAERALYNSDTHAWTLHRGMIAHFDAAGDITTTDYFPKTRTISEWSETPWRIVSSQLDPAGLSVSELRSYLRHNSDFPDLQLAPYRAHLADRYALPLFCLVAVLIAAPLGIVFSRRGILGSLFAALLIFVALIPGHDLLFAFGKGGRLPPALAPWLPQIAGLVIGLILLWFRSTSRDLPSFRRSKIAVPRPA